MTIPKKITVKRVQDATWEQVYFYNGATMSFTTLASDTIPGMTITHTKPKGKPTRSEYRVFSHKRTDSIHTAVRYYNEEVHRRELNARGERPEAAGSPEQAKRLRNEAGRERR